MTKQATIVVIDSLRVNTLHAELKLSADSILFYSFLLFIRNRSRDWQFIWTFFHMKLQTWFTHKVQMLSAKFAFRAQKINQKIQGNLFVFTSLCWRKNWKNSFLIFIQNQDMAFHLIISRIQQTFGISFKMTSSKTFYP